MLQISRILQRNSVGSVTHLITDYWFLITPLILSGCMGVYEGGFECPPGKGMGCKSISEVNQMVNQCSVPGIQYPESGTVSSPSEHRTLNAEHCSVPGIQYPESGTVSSPSEHRTLNTEHCSIPGIQYPEELKLSLTTKDFLHANKIILIPVF